MLCRATCAAALLPAALQAHPRPPTRPQHRSCWLAPLAVVLTSVHLPPACLRLQRKLVEDDDSIVAAWEPADGTSYQVGCVGSRGLSTRPSGAAGLPRLLARPARPRTSTCLRGPVTCCPPPPALLTRTLLLPTPPTAQVRSLNYMRTKVKEPSGPCMYR